MDKKSLSERDICSKFITPAIQKAGWDIVSQVREEFSYTKGRITVRGKLVTRGKAKRVDYLLSYKQNIPLALIEAKDNIVSVFRRAHSHDDRRRPTDHHPGHRSDRLFGENPHIDRDDYLKQLREAGIDPLTLAQLEKGDWDAVAGGRFKREWFDQSRYTTRGDYLVLRRTGEATERTVHIWGSHPRFLTIDPAASAKTTADWTVIAAWLQTAQNELVLLDIDRFQADSPDIPPRVEARYRKWRCSGAWIEAVGANDAVYKLCSRLPIAARRLNPLGQDKLVRATEAMNLAASGRIWFPQHAGPGLPLAEFESELYRFSGDDRKDAHDDAVDALSYAAKVLVRGPTVEERMQVPYVIGGR